MNEVKSGLLSKIVYKNFLWGSGLFVLLVASTFDFLIPREVRPLFLPESFQIVTSSPIFGRFFKTFFPTNLVQHLFQILYLVTTAFVVQHLVTEFRLIRVRSYFPFFLVCLLSAAVLPLIPFDGTYFANLLFILSCLRLLSDQECRQANKTAFDSALLLGLASLLQPHLLFLLPVFWWVMLVMQFFNFKTFLTSLLGVLVIAWLLAGASFLLDDWRYLRAFSNEIFEFRLLDFTSLPKPEAILLLFLAVLFLSALLSFWPRQHLEKLRTRNSLNSILIIWLGLAFNWFFSADYVGYLLFLLTISSVVIAHFFSLVDNYFSRFMFLCIVILSVAAYLFY
jgi:hypothetical protein